MFKFQVDLPIILSCRVHRHTDTQTEMRYSCGCNYNQGFHWLYWTDLTECKVK